MDNYLTGPNHPGAAVVGAAITIMLAVSESDSLVKDNYYKEGLAINKEMARERLADDMGIRLTLAYNDATGRFIAGLNGAPVGNLEFLALTLTHPTMAEQDRKLRLVKNAAGAFESDEVSDIASANWHLTITPPEETWKLSGRWNPREQTPITLPRNTEAAH